MQQVCNKKNRKVESRVYNGRPLIKQTIISNCLIAKVPVLLCLRVIFRFWTYSDGVIGFTMVRALLLFFFFPSQPNDFLILF